MDLYDTIAAISTPPGEGGIGIIRVSGDMAREIGDKIFKPYTKEVHLKSHRLYYGYIVDPKKLKFLERFILEKITGKKEYQSVFEEEAIKDLAESILK